MTGGSADRKRDHLELCASNRVNFKNKTTLLEQVDLIHRALPEMSLEDVDLKIRFCGKELEAPLWLSAMTGGTAEAMSFNRLMAGLAEELGLGFCLGSIKPMLRDPKREPDFSVRDAAPSTLVMGNIGGTEIAVNGAEATLEALSRIGADGLTVHLNPAMELIQPGGELDFTGVVDGIARLMERAPDLPVVVKETGCGLSFRDGELLKQAGVRRVEIAGAGGTSWVGVETLRAQGAQARLGEMLWDWGVPTAVSTAWLVEDGFEVVAAGGIRSALDAARALSLGARLVGFAAPLVREYFTDAKDDITRVKQYLNEFVDGLRAVLYLTGARKPEEMASVPRVIGPDLARWIDARRPRER